MRAYSVYVTHTLTIRKAYAEYARHMQNVCYTYVGINRGQCSGKYVKGHFPQFSLIVYREKIEKIEAALLQYQFNVINMTLHYIIIRNGGQRTRKRSRMGWKQFCRHLDTTEFTLEMKVMKQSTRERWCYVTHRFINVMHTLLIRSYTLCIRYSYAHIRFAYVTHTLTYASQTVINVTLTDRRR